MKHKEEYKKLVEIVKNRAKENGKKIRNEDIATKLGISRTYLSDLIGLPGKDVTPKHIEDFKAHFREELSGAAESNKPALPGDSGNRERALIKVLMHRVAKLEADRLGMPVEAVLAELEKDTMIAWRDLEQGSAKE